MKKIRLPRKIKKRLSQKGKLLLLFEYAHRLYKKKAKEIWPYD